MRLKNNIHIKYICDCGMDFKNKKDNYERHKNKKKPCVPNDNQEQNNNIYCVELKNNIINDNKINELCELNDIFNNKNNSNQCAHCLKTFARKYGLERHLDGRCKELKKQPKINISNFDEIKQELNGVKKVNEDLKQQINILIPKTNNIDDIHKSIKDLEITIPANTNLKFNNQLIEQLIQKDKQLEEFIVHKSNNFKSNIPDDNFDDLIGENTIIKNKQFEIEQNDDKNPMTLILNQNIIDYRKSDGFINATQLCKAGCKKFSHWISLESTKELIRVLASDAGIPASLLVDIKKGNSNNFEQGTWIHPDLAIQLAQWISPSFVFQVSIWIRTIFTKGKVDINLKIIKEQENIIKDRDKRIKVLENMILKKQTRNKYDESTNVVYIITNEYTKSKRTYTIGKAKNLIERLSTYDKLQTHEVIYSKSFKNESQMKIAEDIVLTKLNKYKEIECRDRFVLPIGEDIKIFIKPITDVFNLLTD